MGRFSLAYVLLVPHVVHKHHLVQAPGPGLTVVFLIFVVLAQGGGGVGLLLLGGWCVGWGGGGCAVVCLRGAAGVYGGLQVCCAIYKPKRGHVPIHSKFVEFDARIHFLGVYFFFDHLIIGCKVGALLLCEVVN